MPGLGDCHLSDGIKPSSEVGTNSPLKEVDENFDITISNLPEKLGFSAEFQEELTLVGGNVEFLAKKLLKSHDLSDRKFFQEGKLCSTPKKLAFYTKTLDVGLGNSLAHFWV